MTTATTSESVAREPRLLGQTVVVIGGSAGIGLETARLARRRAQTSSSLAATRSASSKQRGNFRRETAPPSTPTTQRP